MTKVNKVYKNYEHLLPKRKKGKQGEVIKEPATSYKQSGAALSEEKNERVTVSKNQEFLS